MLPRIACSIALFLLTFSTGWAGRIVGIDVAEDRAVVHVQGDFHYRSFRLSNPARLVIDLRGVRLGKPSLELPLRLGPLRGLRSARRYKDGQRLVFDLAHPLEPEVVSLAGSRGSQRLVVRFDGGAAVAGHADAESRVSKRVRGDDCPVRVADDEFVVAVDAGHGGRDKGAVGHHGHREKDIALQVAKRLRKLIDGLPRARAVMTRDTDRFVTLRERYRLAQTCGADLLISIHADALPGRRVQGASVYVYQRNRRGNRDRSLWKVALRGAHAVEASDAASQAAGSLILDALGERTRLLRRKLLSGRFTVLSSSVPSVLVETGFIDHKREELRLASAEYQQKLAEALQEGIVQFARLMREARDPYEETLHVVGSRTTLDAVADRFGVSVKALRTANLIEHEPPRIGTVLRIPQRATDSGYAASAESADAS